MKYLRLFESNINSDLFVIIINNLLNIIGLECNLHFKDKYDWSFIIEFESELSKNRKSLISNLIFPIVNYDCNYIITMSSYMGKNTIDGNHKIEYSGRNWNEIYKDILNRLIKRYEDREDYLYTSTKGNILINGRFILNAIVKYLKLLDTYTFDKVKKNHNKSR